MPPFAQFEVQIQDAAGQDPASLRKAIVAGLLPKLREPLHSFRETLIKEHAADLGHENSAEQSKPTASEESKTIGISTAPRPPVAAKKASVSSAKLRRSSDLAISRSELWTLLTDESRIPMWTRAPASVSSCPRKNIWKVV